ncbi:FKBP-type peptidyl-prolyl cis-trans isomerase [Demequina sp. NBRC 110055]|uniref:FKBP-type peptidyl-prolyl cis-trans isomerase n=1 Tax=Demequina sp. NBRC 110055 TaxID=1570344 RepID=UPI001F42DB16|nr:FKBP-type peptidyl-prolyl cis-trans isomerase [Demequina sp. NBRC 110055]
MITTRWTAAVAIGALSVLGLTACSSDAETDATTSPSAEASAPAEVDNSAAEAALEEITWTDGEDAPTLEFEAPLNVDNRAARAIAPGDGEPVEDGDVVNLAYTVWSGEDGSQVYSTYEGGVPEAITFSEESVTDTVLYDAIKGQNVGATFIYAFPSSEADDGTVTPSQYMAVTVDSVTTVLDGPEGAAVEPDEGLPTVTLDDTGKPSIDFADAGEMPTELVVQPLIEGEGDVVEETDTLTVNYTGWIWDGEQFDSSWDRGTTASFPLSNVIAGWTQGLAGQTVGSQVLLVIPPDLGYGDSDTSSIPGGSTLVFVVDILAAS